jgi:serine/threonine protein kinase
LAGERYRLLGLLERGGMSQLYLALDDRTGERVVIKLLDDRLTQSVEDRERFRRETLIAARLEHPHIIPCCAAEHRPDMALAVMPYVPGHSLGELTADGRQMSWPDVLAWLIPIADALAYAHERGVVHRDVKPENILLREGDRWPFLTDFGVATLRTSEASRAEIGQRLGTPEFMSPEQVLGTWDADHRSDIYSLGLTAYVALSGRMPFKASTPVGSMTQRVSATPAPLSTVAPEVPRRLATVIDRCLRREPRRRWSSAQKLCEVLGKCVPKTADDAGRGAVASDALQRRHEVGHPAPHPLAG